MYNFKNKLASNAGRNAPKETNTFKGSVIKPFPELPENLQRKLGTMFECLLDLSGRTYSSLSLDEKRLVEYFCKRSEVTEKGNSSKGSGRTVLKIGAYQHRFLIRALKCEYFAQPNFDSFHIFEDERMDFTELYGDRFEYTGSPMHDGLVSYPNRYLPVRASDGKAVVMAVYSGRSPSDLGLYVYRERRSINFEEPRYQNPLLPQETKEEVVSINPYQKFIDEHEEFLESGLFTSGLAAFIDKWLESPEFRKLVPGFTPSDKVLARNSTNDKTHPRYLETLSSL